MAQSADSVQLHTGPARGVVALAAGSTISTPIRGLWIQTAGDVVAVFADGTQATFSVNDKTILPISPASLGAGTTAGGLVGFL